MTSRFHTAHAYNAFDHAMRKAETRLATSPATLLAFPQLHVRRRIAQRLVEILLAPGIRTWAATGNHAHPPFSAGETSAQGVSLNVETGAVGVQATALLMFFSGFVVRWLGVLAWLLHSLVRPSKLSRGAATVLLGVGQSDIWLEKSDHRFVRFCTQGPVTPLARAGRIVVQSAAQGGEASSPRVSYAKYPLRDLLRSAQIPFKARLTALLSHLMLAPRVLLDIVRAPVAAIVAPDCAYAALTGHLDRCGLIENIVITNSLYMWQPLWMCALPARRFRAHMVWYSQNTVPVVYATDNERSNIPNYRHMRLDEHWVWTEQYAKQLRNLGSDATIHAVGPILWYLPEAGSRQGNIPTVVVFDVTPVKEGFARQIGLVKNYYSASNMIAFVEQVVAACEKAATRLGQPILVLLKHKRGHSEVHDRSYLQFVKNLADAGRIQLAPAQTNLYSLIAASSATVVVPYSSPAQVAATLGVPAIYFDPTQQLVPTHDQEPLVTFASGPAALAAAFDQVFQRRSPQSQVKQAAHD